MKTVDFASSMLPTNPEISMAKADLDDTDLQAVIEVIRTGRLALGPQIAAFEEAMGRYTGARHAIAVNSGTSGLHLVCRALGLSRDDEVITTSFSFVASTNCFLYEGARPVFVDIEPKTYCIDPNLIGAAISPRTKAIVAVDVFGHPADWDALEAIADEHGLSLISDSCESLGSIYKDVKTGRQGHAGVFAFYPNKQITTGEGGCIVTDRDDLASACRSMANQGRGQMTAWLEHERLGFNYRMDELSAALGVSQLARIEHFIAKRVRVAARYHALLEGESRVRTPQAQSWPGTRVNPFVYVVELMGGASRDEVMRGLAAHGVPSRAYFSPIHRQAYIRRLMDSRQDSLPVTERVARKTLALPFHNDLSEEEAAYVVKALRTVLDALT